MPNRNWFMLVLLAATLGMAALAAVAQTAPATKAAPVAVPAGDAVMTAEGLTIDGKLLPVPCTEQQLVEFFGKPSRTTDLHNRIETWDDKGVLAYFSKGSDKANEIHLVLLAQTYEFWPKKLFGHKVWVSGVALDGKCSRVELKAAGFVESAIWNCKLGPKTVYADTDVDVKAINQLSLHGE